MLGKILSRPPLTPLPSLNKGPKKAHHRPPSSSRSRDHSPSSIVAWVVMGFESYAGEDGGGGETAEGFHPKKVRS